MEEFSNKLQSIVDQVYSKGLVFCCRSHKPTGVKVLVMKQMKVSSKLLALFHIKQPFADRPDAVEGYTVFMSVSPSVSPLCFCFYYLSC